MEYCVDVGCGGGCVMVFTMVTAIPVGEGGSEGQ